MTGCDLCDLPVPDSPVRPDMGEGAYCCRGCMRIATTLEDVEEVSELEDASVDDEDVPPEATVGYFRVEGMHCTTCEAFVQSRGADAEGIYDVDVSYGLGAARVRYDPARFTDDAVAEALSGYGYTVVPRNEDTTRVDRNRYAQRVVIGGFLAMLVMPWYLFALYPAYLGFETGILDLGRTNAVGTYFPLATIGLITGLILAYTGYPLLRGAWISLTTRRPNMDLLVAIAALSAFVYSVLALAMGSTHLYFDVSIMVVLIVGVGRHYERSLHRRVTEEVPPGGPKSPDEAVRVDSEGPASVPIEELRGGDEVLVHPGERVPLDGVVSEGTTDVDESLLTGESIPVAKEPGDDVIGGSTVLGESMTVEIGPSARSTAARITEAMWEIQSDRPSIQRFVDALATVFVPVILVLGTSVFAWRLLAGDPFPDAMLWGLTVLLVSCPCAMGLATPLATSAGLRDAIRGGIVVTNPSVFETAAAAEHVVFDKTGTLTAGEMEVREVRGDPETLPRAAAVEGHADHPIAEAIVAAHAHPRPDGGAAAGAAMQEARDFRAHPGRGVSAAVGDDRVFVGRPGFLAAQLGPPDEELRAAVERLHDSGSLAIVVGWNDRIRGVIGLDDELRPEAPGVLDAAGQRHTVILTGDQRPLPETLRGHPYVDEVFTGVIPAAKAETVERLSADGPTVMVGDGTNDAPAIAAADFGIAMGGGTDSARDAADAIIRGNDLRALETVFDVASGTRRRIRENIGWALLYNAIAIPLAIAGFLNPLFAAVAMAASSIIVVTNSRRSVTG